MTASATRGHIRKCVSRGSIPAGVRFVLILAVVVAGTCGAPSLYGQGGSATVTGTVTDQSNAVIPNINVVLRDEGSGAVRRTVTNSDGFFTIPALPVGTYTLEIDATGFAKWERKGITLHASDRINVPDIVLGLAAVAQEVKVEATPDVVVPVDSGEKSQVILAKQMQNLSIVGRSAVELMKILPGVVYRDQDQEAGLTVQFNRGIGDYNVAGQRNTEIANVSDGQDVIDPGCNCGSAVTPNVDMMQEVKIQTSNFSAENAKGPVIFNAVSKSGTSAYHGEAYTYFRHHKLNSTDWRDNYFDAPKPKDYYYFPGFNLGGPVRIPGSGFNRNKDKMFFFTGIEWMKQNHALGLIPAVVPTANMREGDFSDASYINSLNGYDVNTVPHNDAEGNNNWSADPITPAMLSGGVISPSAIDPGGAVLMSMYPLPNQDPAKSSGYNYSSNIVNPENRNQQLVRIDYNISDNTKFYTRFNHEYQASPSPYTLWWYNSHDVPYPGKIKGDYRTWVVSTSLVRVLNPTTTNEVIFGYTKWRMPHRLLDPQAISRSALGYPYKGLWKNDTDQIPDATDWGGGVADFIQPGGLLDPTIFADKVLINVVDNFTKVAGTHTLKFGAFYQLTTNQEPGTSSDHGDFEFTNWGNNSTGNGYADMLMGRVGEYGEATKNFVGHYRRNEFSFYGQDSWKVTRRFTLELGARFQHQGWFFNEQGYQFGFDPALYDPNAPISAYTGLIAQYKGDPVPKPIWDTKPLVVNPRVGFAYDLSGSGKTVIRGGAGVFSYHGRGGDNWTVGNPPLQFHASICCGILMSDIDAVDPTQNIPKSSVQAVEPSSDQIPTTYSWSFTISRRLPYSTVLETSYVGNSASHQITCSNCNANNINAVPEGTMLPDKVPTGADANNYRPYKSYNSIRLISHSLSQNYHSLQVTLNRQTGRINYAAAYTWSKALGTGGETYGYPVDPFDRRNRSYGPLNYDRTHSFSIAYNVLLPDPARNNLLKHFVNGWQVSGITLFQSGGPLGIPTDAGTQFTFSGDLGIIDPRTGEPMEFSATNIAGTPDTAGRPVLVCDPRTGLADGQYANPNCFRAPTPGHNGMYQLPYMKTPGFQNHDLSVFKNFALSSTNEALKLQFRLSMFNFLNHPLPFFEGGARGVQMNFVNGVPDQNTLEHFGRPDLKRGRRLLQLALKFSF
jgi:hypothetical protein